MNSVIASDAVALAVMASRLESVVRSMMNTVFRTARSGVINSAHDFSCCILTGEHELVASAESLPIHVMAGPNIMARWMKQFHPDLRQGDAFLHNSPYHGNSHAADYSILVPVVDDRSVHRLTILVKAHQADCGNGVPTTYHASARDVYEEGALIFPAVKVQEDYQDLDDFIRVCRLRIRVPDQWWGDYLALVGAARIGERRLMEIAKEVGWEALSSHCRQWFDYSESRMRSAIRRLPAGRATVTSHHDPFPNVPAGIPVKVEVDVDPDQERIAIDLRDNVDCQPCGLNLTESTALTAAMIGVFNSIDPTVPPNEGSFRRLDIRLRENCVVGIPRHPASCSVATTNLADRVANAVQRAIAGMADGFGMAECGCGLPSARAVISGQDPRVQGAAFVNQLFLVTTGGAGAPSADGWLTHGIVGGAGNVLCDAVEVAEIHHPIRIHSQRLIPDTEAAGRYRGSPAAYVEYGPVGCSIDIAFAADGAINASRGVRGGADGPLVNHYKRARNGRIESLPSVGLFQLKDGETVICASSSGGGYGVPFERAPERVAHDVRERWVTRRRARDIYGVIVRFDGSVDTVATMRLRGSPTVSTLERKRVRTRAPRFEQHSKVGRRGSTDEDDSSN